MTNRQTLGPRREHVRVNACIIGAGFGGLIAATRLAARTGLSVIVLESGTSTTLDQQDPLLSLDTVHNPDGFYQGRSRGRGIGGTSAKWAGKLLPLSAHDMAARPYLDLPAWPLDQSALSRYTPEIEAMMQVDVGSYENSLNPTLDPRQRLPDGMDDIVWRWPKRPALANHRIDHVLREQLERLPNLTIWTDATVTALHAHEGRLASVTATNHRGGELVVNANSFIISAGTLESTRLLLIADAQNDGCISRTTDSLGRYFNDHMGLEVAVLRSAAMPILNRALADRKVNGTVRHLHGELSPSRQETARVGSGYFDFDAVFSPDAATSKVRATIASLRCRDVAGAIRHIIGAAADPKTLGRALIWRALYGQQYWPDDATVNVKIWIEQLPVHTNRLSLAERQDALGSPMLRVDLVKSDIDEQTLRTTMDSLYHFWRRNMPDSTLQPILLPIRAIDAAYEQAHPAGSARMGRDSRYSVVDPSLRVHALPNVQVVSAAVFPSSGSANPTMTIMQMAMLATDH